LGLSWVGSSIAMIDRHTATLTRDNREHAVALLDALALERAVDDAWTSKPTPRKRAQQQRLEA
jgi:hypothetical protein